MPMPQHGLEATIAEEEAKVSANAALEKAASKSVVFTHLSLFEFKIWPFDFFWLSCWTLK